MSKSNHGLRRAGASGLAVALGLGVASLSAGAAFAATPGLHAASNPDVTQGMTDQAAGDLTYTFTNEYTTGAKVVFSLPAATCDTQANINKAIEFASAPTVAITHDTSTDTGRIPTFSSALGSSSTQCGTAGIQDTFTVTLNQPSSGGTTADLLDLALSKVAYNVGSAATPGAVSVTATATGITSAPAPSSDTNATVVNKSFMVMPKMSATPGETGAALGTASYKESTPGAFFAAGDNTVTLTLTGGSFTAGVKPTISVPSGYTVSSTTGGTDGAPTTSASGIYTFHVTAPATPVAATVTVSGLKVDAPGTTQTVSLNSSIAGGSPTSLTVKVLNVVDQARTGGSDRYATAASLFNKQFPGTKTNVVLSGGELFPDALSANYLAKELTTGTLLTRQDKLSQPARQAIISHNVSTVYITGDTAAVSQSVEDGLKATHVGDAPFGSMIQVIRLGGANRYDTNAAINRNNLSSHDTVVMAAGTAPYDSLAVGPIVYKNTYPLVLTNGSNLNNGEVGQINDFGAKNVVIVGGVSVVSQATQDALKADGYNVVRLAGATRYATAAQIATWGTAGFDFNGDGAKSGTLEGNQGLTANTTNITDGLGFADALAAGPVAGANSQPILLAQNPTTVGSALSDYLGTKTVGSAGLGATIDTLKALGLTDVTANSMMKDAAAAIG